MKKQVDDPEAQCRWLPEKKTRNSAEFRRTRRKNEAKEGGPTSKAAIKTTVLRDGGESLSCWTCQGSVQGKVARGH